MALAAFAVTAIAVPATDTYAQAGAEIQKGIDASNPDPSQDTELFGAGSIFVNIVNALLFLIGAISVIMLIYGGIRYTASGGSSTSVTAAKNTIMYAVIGLVVAFLAFAIVNWVLSGLGGTTA